MSFATTPEEHFTMSEAINSAFQVMLAGLEPTATETAARRSHATSIEQGLRQEFPNLSGLVEFGSHKKNTAIRSFSDVDFLAKLGRDDIRRAGAYVTSTTTLGRLKDAMKRRFPSTDVWIDGVAVVVAFDGGRNAVDVTPSVYEGTTPIDGYPVFLIPDGLGGWQKTSPERHGKYIRESDDRARGKLSGTIRLLKSWKYVRAARVPFLGFHAELLLGSEAICEGVKSYAECLRDSFRLLRDRGGRALNDPVKLSSRIPLANSDAQAQQVVDAARQAAEQADLALRADAAGDIAEARKRWGYVFNGNFPQR